MLQLIQHRKLYRTKPNDICVTLIQTGTFRRVLQFCVARLVKQDVAANNQRLNGLEDL